ncbi:penicillin-binding protein [Haloechinothrix sp. YIM 98757]|uniref:Penicillin-binding protein n=1 Tax=Haloechinothrix aidingensis TaxID=2752311 RepID=A0A838AFU5_9PSEU|nr:penicillin-binding protein [Haloechinothrix aidingensis]
MRSTTRVLAVATVLGVTAGCGIFSDPAGDRAEEFFLAVADGDVSRAAELTDAPERASRVLDQALEALEPESIEVSVEESQDVPDSASSSVDYELTWHLGDERTWSYSASAELVDSDDGWRVRWTPAVLHPDLAPEHTIALLEMQPELAPVLDRDGRELLSAQRVTSVLLEVDKLDDSGGLEQAASGLASELSRFDEEITTESIMSGAGDTEDGEPYVVAALREDDFQAVEETIAGIPGVRFTWQERLLAPERDFGRAILPPLRRMVEERAAERSGWRVITLDAVGAEARELASERPEPVEAVDSTVLLPAQSAAEEALEEASTPGALVAMDVSSGDLLAVGQNSAADEHGPIALTGQYPPGSTFKIVTAAAGMSAGEVHPDGEVDCPGSTAVGSRMVTNDDEFDLGTTDLTTAFARSCNTTFAQLAAELDDDALPDTAASLGIGAEFDIPGTDVFTGSVPEPENVAERAENGFGQGTVLASPFGMALAASAVANGSTPTPSVIDGPDTEVSGLGDPLDTEVNGAVRDLMRAVVTDGTAGELDALDGVHGKTGTAQFGDGSDAHGWFVGYQDDLAFAVLLVGGGSSQPAVEVTRNFLEGLPSAVP